MLIFPSVDKSEGLFGRVSSSNTKTENSLTGEKLILFCYFSLKVIMEFDKVVLLLLDRERGASQFSQKIVSSFVLSLH